MGNVLNMLVVVHHAENCCLELGFIDQDPHDQPKRRRVRKHKSKKNVSHPSSVHVEETELEEQRGLLEEGLQPRHADGPTISKNKKRKLKKKQQVKRKRAAGLLTKAAGISFLYAPGEGDSEPGDSSEGAGGGGSDAEDPGDAGDKEDREDSVDAKQDGGEGSDDQAEGILDFLKSTQEMYFYDGMFFPVFLLNNGIYLFGKIIKNSIIFKCLKYKITNIENNH